MNTRVCVCVCVDKCISSYSRSWVSWTNFSRITCGKNIFMIIMSFLKLQKLKLVTIAFQFIKKFSYLTFFFKWRILNLFILIDKFHELESNVKLPMNNGSGLTNWDPVSLRMPIPAEAKLAPVRSLLPLSRGLRYGKTESAPSRWPDYIKIQSSYLIN